jgi:hypothetical protein
MRRCHFVITLSILVFVARTDAAEPFRYPDASYGTGTLTYIDGLPVVTVSGTPEEIGEAVGALALGPAERMVSYPEDLLKHYHCGFLRATFLRQGNRMVESFPDEYRRELETISRTSHVDHDHLVLGNTLFDLKKMLACSALLVEADASATGKPLLARNLDYPALGYAHEYSLITIYHPKGKHAFASIGFPGLVGCLSGMNDAGLAVAVLEVFQIKLGLKKLDRAGVPYALCYRRILEECTTIEEAKALLEQMHRTTTTNLVLADPSHVAILEVSPQQVIARADVNGTGVCTNHFCTDPLKPFFRVNVSRSFERFRTLEAAGRVQDRFDLADLHRSLHAACNEEETLQSMIFEPATLRLHLAIGRCPASAGEMTTLELAPLLKRD